MSVPAEAYPAGHTVPRIYPKPLAVGPPGPCGCGCALTEETSDGFLAVDWLTDVLGQPPDPWQRWLLIHALEVLPDGRPRFRRVVVLVARQNGKTYLLAALACVWLYLFGPMYVLGSSTKTAMAIKAWKRSIGFARAVPELAAMIPKRGGVLTGSGHEQWNLSTGALYEPVASNEEGGRGDSLDRVIADEGRQQHDYSAYGAAYHAMRARPFAQYWMISSMGDDRSVVLNDMRESALDFMETGEGDPRLAVFEYSPPPGADPLNPEHLAMANPNVGHRFDMQDLLNEASVAVRKGGQILTDFKTEAMNIRVQALDPAIDADAWRDTTLDGDLEGLRAGLCACLDVTPDMRHITLTAGALMPDGRVRVEAVRAFEGPGAVVECENWLPGWLTRNKIRLFGWMPGGPAAALVASLRERKGRTAWPPRGVVVREIGGEVTGACMAFAALVEGLMVVHAADPLLDAQARAATKLYRQGEEVWRFGRTGETYADAMYACAGVVLLARTLPTPRGRPRVIVPTQASG